jgi:hypothetical protein
MPFVAPDVSDDEVQIRDFTLKKKRIRFKIDKDLFEGYAILGLPLMQDLIKSAKSIKTAVTDEKFDSVFEIFDKLLYPESAKRLRERSVALGDDALDVKQQVIPIMYFLLEEHGLRPTQPSSDSSTGSPSETDGITLTDGPPLLESIPQS